MKTIAIVSSFDIYQSQGVNYVTNTFLQGRAILEERGYSIKYLISPYNIIECDKIDCLPQFGTELKNQSKSQKKTLKQILKYFISNKTLITEIFGYLLRDYREILLTEKHMLSQEVDACDIVLFQGTGVASKYKSVLRAKFKKSVIIMHTGGDIWEFFRINRPHMSSFLYTRLYYQNFVKSCINNCDRLVTLSKKASITYDWVSEEKKDIVFNGISDLSIINKERHRKINFVCVASLQARKGQLLLVEAFNLLPIDVREDVHLYLVGGGEDYLKLQEVIEKYNLSAIISLIGVRNDVPKFLETMDVFILPSYAEGLPISIIEALRQGLYIMTTDVGGCSEMIEDECGEIISHVPSEIASKIEKIVKERKFEFCEKKSRNKYLSSFSLNSMMNGYADVFDKLQFE